MRIMDKTEDKSGRIITILFIVLIALIFFLVIYSGGFEELLD